MMDLLATVSASDEISQSIWRGAHLCFILAIGAAAGAVVLRLLPGKRNFRIAGCLLSAIGLILGLLNLAFVIHVYRIDYVAEAWDGTPASRPILEVLTLPALPVLLASIAGYCWFFQSVRALQRR